MNDDRWESLLVPVLDMRENGIEEYISLTYLAPGPTGTYPHRCVQVSHELPTEPPPEFLWYL